MQAHISSCVSRYIRRQYDNNDHDSSQVSDDVTYSHYYDFPFSYSSMKSSALPIQSSLISLPSNTGSADLLSLLPDSIKQKYSSPAALIRPIHERKRVPRVMLCASPTEYSSLVHRMHALGMLEFTLHPEVINGVFAVAKDGDKQRLIIDARPANAVLIDPPKVELPTPDLLSQLVAPTDQDFYVAKVDLDNYYHHLALPKWMRPYFALPPIRADEVGLQSKFGSNTLIYPSCCTLPMGWSHSVYLAQVVHEHLLDTKTTLVSTDRITATNDFRIDRVRHQVYIDDLNIFGPDKQVIIKMQEQYIEAAEAAGLPVKRSKVITPRSDGVPCLGIEVNGRSHEVGISVSKLVELCHQTVALINSNVCTGLALTAIVGKWTWAALVKRPVLSVLSAVYRYIECAGARLFTLWPSVKREVKLSGL